MKSYISIVVLLIWTLTDLTCYAQKMARVNIIPQPSAVKEQPGVFKITQNTKIISDPEFTEVAALFSEQTGIRIANKKIHKNYNQFNFKLVNSDIVPDSSGYQLLITPTMVTLSARTAEGEIYGMYTLMQLIALQSATDSIPCIEINDHPRFGYRGVMLDVSRHYFSVDYIKHFLDVMALYKMNKFHWHLTDGPGWRLEIKKYPELTAKTSWRTPANWKDWWETARHYSEEGKPNAYGGCYTQEQAKEIVAYAGRRGITVIPEIEMPGHSDEVFAVFPYLCCSGKSYSSSEYCLGNDSVYTFLENVLTEVIGIFPSEYIHIGGDEVDKSAWRQCPKCQKRIRDEKLKDEDELQSYSMRRIEHFLNEKGKKLLGWDEIIEGGLAPAATVMSWQGEEGGIAAAELGHNVIMTPSSHCYFDHYQADPATEPLAMGGYLTLEKVYSYEPVPVTLDSGKAKYILGAQANIWTEYISTTEHLEYMTFPRMLAMAELTWSEKRDRDYDKFKMKLKSHFVLMKKLNLNYYR